MRPTPVRVRIAPCPDHFPPPSIDQCLKSWNPGQAEVWAAKPQVRAQPLTNRWKTEHDTVTTALHSHSRTLNACLERSRNSDEGTKPKKRVFRTTGYVPVQRCAARNALRAALKRTENAEVHAAVHQTYVEELHPGYTRTFRWCSAAMCFSSSCCHWCTILVGHTSRVACEGNSASSSCNEEHRAHGLRSLAELTEVHRTWPSANKRPARRTADCPAGWSAGWRLAACAPSRSCGSFRQPPTRVTVTVIPTLNLIPTLSLTRPADYPDGHPAGRLFAEPVHPPGPCPVYPLQPAGS